MIQQEQFSLVGASEQIIYGDLTYDDKNTNTPVAIFIHGFKGFKDWGAHNLMARHFANNGFRFLKFNFSHSGVDPNDFTDITNGDLFAANTFSKELVDINIIINHTVKYLGVDDVYLIGHSRGGGIAILQAVSNPYVKAVATWSSISDFSSLWKKEQEIEWIASGKLEILNARTKKKMHLDVGLLRDFNSNKEALNIMEAAKKINIPWLIVHGEEDVNVPFATAINLHNANINSRLAKILDANHVYGANHPYLNKTLPPQLLEVCEKTLKFFSNIMP